jgi:hypothetical protein
MFEIMFENETAKLLIVKVTNIKLTFCHFTISFVFISLFHGCWFTLSRGICEIPCDSLITNLVAIFHPSLELSASETRSSCWSHSSWNCMRKLVVVSYALANEFVLWKKKGTLLCVTYILWPIGAKILNQFSTTASLGGTNITKSFQLLKSIGD